MQIQLLLAVEAFQFPFLPPLLISISSHFYCVYFDLLSFILLVFYVYWLFDRIFWMYMLHRDYFGESTTHLVEWKLGNIKNIIWYTNVAISYKYYEYIHVAQDARVMDSGRPALIWEYLYHRMWLAGYIILVALRTGWLVQGF